MLAIPTLITAVELPNTSAVASYTLAKPNLPLASLE